MEPTAIQKPGVTVVSITSARLEFTDEQRRMIRDTFANGATDSEFSVLMEVARARNLNPLLRQIHFVKRWDTNKGREVWSTQVSIDGLRAIAERTGRYDGQGEPEYEHGPNGTIKLCKVRVYRKDFGRPAVGVAYWDEYVQMKKGGGPNAMWTKFAHVMIAKCAEALALRKAFPEDTAGLYVPEEMPAETSAEAEPAPRPVSREPTNQSAEAQEREEKGNARALVQAVNPVVNAVVNPVPVQARAREVWKRFAAAAHGSDIEKQVGFKAWAKRLLRHDRGSAQWTEAEVGLLEAAFREGDVTKEETNDIDF